MPAIGWYYNVNVFTWRHGQVVRQRSAKPLSPVQIRLVPDRKTRLESTFWAGFVFGPEASMYGFSVYLVFIASKYDIGFHYEALAALYSFNLHALYFPCMMGMD